MEIIKVSTWPAYYRLWYRLLDSLVVYWVKILHANDNKYVKKVYNMLKYDFESNPDKKNWCSLLYDVHLVLMMHGYFKILVIVYCFCHLLNSD